MRIRLFFVLAANLLFSYRPLVKLSLLALFVKCTKVFYFFFLLHRKVIKWQFKLNLAITEKKREGKRRNNNTRQGNVL